MIRSRCISSDIMVGFDGCVLTEHSDRYVLRTPNQPDFWYGNCVIFKDYGPEPEAQIAQYRRDFPDTSHITLQWDVPNLTRDSGHAALEQQGFNVDAADALTLRGKVHTFSLPDGLRIKTIQSDTEWQAVIALQFEIGVQDEGYSPEKHLPYLQQRFGFRRDMAEKGSGAWFGVFDGQALVADLGLFTNGKIARFQSVETREGYRRQGVCAALVSHACTWLATKAPEALAVIVAETDGAPGRIYRRCGFTHEETVLSAVKPGY